MEYYLQIDEKENALDSLQKATEFLKNIKNDQLYWKWFIIAIHHAIYHFMLLALQNTDLSGIWKESQKLELPKLTNYRSSRKIVGTENSENKLVTFLEAFNHIQEKDRMSGYVNAKPFIANTRHKEAATRLNTILRNNFVHFSPKGWSIEILYITETISPMLEVVEFLVLNSGRLFLDERQQNGVQSDIAQIRLFFSDRSV